MPDLGRLIHRRTDAEGEIHVYQDAQFRYLTFGNAVEQSCLDLANPLRLEHVYTQAMMLALLLVEDARRLLLLGLGGASLARALRAAGRGLRIIGVERRAAVIEVAGAHFLLPDDGRFLVVCSDAEAYLRQPGEAFDLVFADLYHAEGMFPGQATEAFLSACRERLSDSGTLVVNRWASEYQAHRSASEALAVVFDDQVLSLYVQGGNIIDFAFRSELPVLRRDVFFAAAQSLGLRLAIPLQRHARNLWRQNAETLGVGRFRSRRPE